MAAVAVAVAADMAVTNNKEATADTSSPNSRVTTELLSKDTAWPRLLPMDSSLRRMVATLSSSRRLPLLRPLQVVHGRRLKLRMAKFITTTRPLAKRSGQTRRDAVRIYLMNENGFVGCRIMSLLTFWFIVPV